jgi:hypothetical protein
MLTGVGVRYRSAGKSKWKIRGRCFQGKRALAAGNAEISQSLAPGKAASWQFVTQSMDNLRTIEGERESDPGP